MKNIYRDTAKGKSYFYYYGWTILAFLAAFFLIFFFIFQAIFHVKRTERVDLFIAAYGLKDEDYYKTIQKTFAKDGLVEMNIYSYLESDPNVYNYFTANGENADYVIFSETNVKDMNDYVKYNYFNIDDLKENVPSVVQYDTYQFEGVSYGIKIYDGIDETYNDKHAFKDLIEFTNEGKEKESYYLLVDNGSPNFDQEGKHILGYSVLEYLLSNMLK